MHCLRHECFVFVDNLRYDDRFNFDSIFVFDTDFFRFKLFDQNHAMFSSVEDVGDDKFMAIFIECKPCLFK